MKHPMKHQRNPSAVIVSLAAAACALAVSSNAQADRIIVVDHSPGHHRASPHHHHPAKPVPRVRRYRDVRVVRRHGRPYHGYGHYYNDNDAYKYLSFTAITLKLLDNLNEAQQRRHEAAQIAATRAQVGEAIVWDEENVSGSVQTIRTGISSFGRQCREFLQTVTIGGRSEQAYGTACRQPDGSWELVTTR
jgi:hypothetical protein